MPGLALDPTDLPRLLATIEGWAESERYPPIELRRVEIGRDALAGVAAVLRDLAPSAGTALLVCDDTPMRRGDRPLKPWLVERLRAGAWEVDVCELAGGAEGTLHADFDRLAEVRAALRPGTPVIALGSGTVTDLVKHGCHEYEQQTGEHLGLIFCPTAVSVLAFSARMAVVAKDGVKRTWPSRLSDVLVFDLATLAQAPWHMTLGGLGDLAVMYTTFADWWLGDALGLAEFFEPSARIMEDVREHLPEAARRLGDGADGDREAGLELLAKLNVLGGLSATLAGESAPLSGYEHVTGHMLDMDAEHAGRRLADHGAQVAVALIPHAIALQMLVHELDPAAIDIDRCYPPVADMERVVRETFAAIDPSGAMAAECWSDYRQKFEAWHRARDRFTDLLDDWPAARGRLAAWLTDPAEIVRVLAAAGAPLRFDELSPPLTEREGRWAFTNAHLMRKRFSAGDLFYLLGWLDAGLSDRVFAERDKLIAAVRGGAGPRSGR